MPDRHFLTRSEPFSHQVAAFISETGLRHSETLLVTPTAGAARSVNRSLASLGCEALKAAQPMQALLPQCETIATPVERSIAWADAVEEASMGDIQALFWKKHPQSVAERLKAGRNFCALCDLLAEAALTPATFELSTKTEGAFDLARWQAITRIYEIYLEKLRIWQLHDPNELRIAQVEDPSDPIKHLILAGISDLPTAVQRFAERLEQRAGKVDLLIWNPGQNPTNDFDDWGRPKPEVWNRRRIAIDSKQIHLAASAGDEARFAVERLSASQATSSLVSVDPKLHSTLASELRFQGQTPFLPEGEPLIRSEAAKLVLEWDDFRRSSDLRTLRRLLELPAFCRALDIENPIHPTEALTAVDHLLGKTIATTLESAWTASPALPDHAPPRARKIRALVRRLLGSTKALLSLSSLQVLNRAYLEGKCPESAARVLELGGSMEASPALQKWMGENGKHLPSQAFAQALRNERIQPLPEGDATTVHGWLEAPWLDSEALILCGIIEGQLPRSVDGDPFLPDSIRQELGLSHNEQRLARDSYMLNSLLQSRPAHSVLLSLSKYNSEGDPNRPSRLLLRTASHALPDRVLELTQTPSSSKARPKRQTSWRWSLPSEITPIHRISPTHFESYLSCPFRYCLEKSFRMDAGPVAAREMDAAVFGNLIHRVLENFGNYVIPMQANMLNLDEQTIRTWTQEELRTVAREQFGPTPAPAVQVQIANASARLHGFANVQASCFAEGWVILAVERKLEAEGENPLQIGPLQLSGIIDRIEQNQDTGALRVMDYKTYSATKTPRESHVGPASHNWLPEALLEIEGKRTQTKTWKNLQLPLYRKILTHWYPDETAQMRPDTAYFILPSDPLETGIYTFDELNDPGIYDAAMTCAKVAAERIAQGVFWPPQPHRKSWDDPFAPIFANGAPEDCITAESIENLKGARR
jgi:ATP-dependent helicase/nuclease subunit B